MMCGMISSGKSTHAAALRKERRAAVLSVDEITLALFEQDTGDMHDTYVARAEAYLYQKSLELLDAGIDVILDWGFWTRQERAYAREFYGTRGIPCELHYIDIPLSEWETRLQKRNAAVQRGEASAYYVDEGLAAKFRAIFEQPDDSEIDVRIT